MRPRASSSTRSIASSPAIRWSRWCCRSGATNGYAVAPVAESTLPAAASTASPWIVRRLGRTDCATTWRAMQAFTAARGRMTADEIWLTEHERIYTLGLAGRREHVLRDNGIAVLKLDRGGQVTYHGPGQLIAYLLLDLRRSRVGVRTLVRRIEAAVIEWLSALGIVAYGKPSAPGVYVE